MAFDKRVGEEKNSGFTFRGQPITLSKTLGRPNGGLVAKGIQRGIYPEKTKIEVVTLYAVTGNIPKVSSLTKVPVDTISKWRKQQWFQELLVEIREENNEKIDAKFTEIIEKALELVYDRMINGDFAVHPKTGELIRKPVSMRDLTIVSAINVDKRQLLRGLPTSRTESVNNGDKLAKLAETFIQLANTKRKEKAIEIEVIENDQENQKRLQSSVGEGEEPRIIEDLGGSKTPAPTSGIFQTKG